MYRGWGQGGIKIIYGLKPMCTTRKISIKKVNYQNLMIVYYYHLPFNERFFPKFLNLLVFQLYFFNSALRRDYRILLRGGPCSNLFLHYSID